jgi:hypothetical protein
MDWMMEGWMDGGMERWRDGGMEAAWLFRVMYVLNAPEKR